MKRIGIIGIGKMGMSHLAIANQTPGLKVAAVCDTSKAFLRVIRKNTDFNCFTDYKKMLDEVEIDGVMVLVPNSLHFDIVSHCIEKGLHVFVEKPLTLSFKESKQLVALSKEKSIKGQVGYVNRFNAVFQRVRKLLDDNVLGKITHYENHMRGGVVLKENSSGWRNNHEEGGGCLFDYGPHCLDLATYLFGTDVSVQGAMLKKVFSSEVEDVAYVNLLHDGEIMGTNSINWSDSSVRKATNFVEVMGTKGKLKANKQELSIYLNEANETLNLREGWNKSYITDEETAVPYYLRGEDFSRQLLEFSDLVNGKIVTSIASLETASITDKIIEEVKIKNGKLL